MDKQSIKSVKVLLLVSLLAFVFLAFQYTGNLGNTVVYDSKVMASELEKLDEEAHTLEINETATTSASTTNEIIPNVEVFHLKTPPVVRAAYMTSCIASGKSLRAPLLGIIDRTKINAVVIDVKDYTGYISVDFGNKEYPIGGKSCLVSDMKEFLAELGNKGVYRIARIAVMQDPYYADKHKDEAILRKDNGAVWKDKKGLAFVDPGSKNFWKYNRDIAYDAYNLGFDEVNFDYVRYPTDGDVSNMSFKLTGTSTKREMMKSFFEYMGKSMKDKSIPSSVDLFGMTTTATVDLGIGQVLEDVLPNFDYVAPMVYPSHYPKGFNNWKDPNTVVGPLTEHVMGAAVVRAKALGLPASKLRTWVQDFDYGKEYTAQDVRAIITASEKVGVKSYMVWDPSNRYTEAAYGTQKEENEPVIIDTASTTKTTL